MCKILIKLLVFAKQLEQILGLEGKLEKNGWELQE